MIFKMNKKADIPFTRETVFIIILVLILFFIMMGLTSKAFVGTSSILDKFKFW